MMSHFRFNREERVTVTVEEDDFGNHEKVATLMQIEFEKQEEWFGHSNLEVLPCCDACVYKVKHLGEWFVVAAGNSDFHGYGYPVVVWIPQEASRLLDTNENELKFDWLPEAPFSDFI